MRTCGCRRPTAQRAVTARNSAPTKMAGRGIASAITSSSASSTRAARSPIPSCDSPRCARRTSTSRCCRPARSPTSTTSSCPRHSRSASGTTMRMAELVQSLSRPPRRARGAADAGPGRSGRGAHARGARSRAAGVRRSEPSSPSRCTARSGIDSTRRSSRSTCRSSSIPRLQGSTDLRAIPTSSASTSTSSSASAHRRRSRSPRSSSAACSTVTRSSTSGSVTAGERCR